MKVVYRNTCRYRYCGPLYSYTEKKTTPQKHKNTVQKSAAYPNQYGGPGTDTNANANGSKLTQTNWPMHVSKLAEMIWSRSIPQAQAATQKDRRSFAIAGGEQETLFSRYAPERETLNKAPRL
jgi:hypothetical protein